uniref:programmed cell death protein 2-like isoform X2 n=1 Tax=Myxine glutinosa TaxID=7769 RepID=UPI00358E4AE7
MSKDPVPGVHLEQPYCGLCGQPLTLVVQLNCPLHTSLLHRTLHVFTCTGKACANQHGSWKVMRSQHLESEQKHPQVVPTPCHARPTDWCQDANDWGDNDESTGMEGSVSVNQHQETAPDSTTLLSPELSRLSLKETSGWIRVSSRGHSAMDMEVQMPCFESFYVSVWEELEVMEEARMSCNGGHVQGLLEDYTLRESVDFAALAVNRCTEGNGEHYERTKVKHGDHAFLKFMKRIESCPEQILRYSWDGHPLFLALPDHDLTAPIPPCPSCSSPRKFELQLMPALVSMLRPVRCNAEELSVEFGTVLVYSCSSSCWSMGQDVAREEFVLVQPDPDQRLFR